MKIHSVFPFLKFWLGFLMLPFAAGADALGGAGRSGEAQVTSGGEGGTTETTDTGDLEYSTETTEGTTEQTEETQRTHETQTTQEEPEVQEFKGAVSRRLVGLVKQSPKLAEAFKENPKLQEQIESVFRREAALREVFPTVAEARQMREHFPNGLSDVQQLLGDVKEFEQLDTDYLTADRDGNYPGHQKIVQGMFEQDRKAGIALFRSLPREWARLDPDSYHEVMGRIVGATLANSRELADLDEALQAQTKDPARIEACAKKVFAWVNGFLREKPRPSADEERLQRDREKFDREKADRAQQDGKTFHTTFVSEAHKLQSEIIRKQAPVQKLLASKTITDAKKADIIEQVRRNIEHLLSKSPSFMRKLRPAYASRNMEQINQLQREAWSQQWLLNRMIRTVFSKEIPSLVANNRKAAGNPGAAQQKKAGTPSDKKETGPKKIGGRWYHDGGNGAPYTPAEILADKTGMFQ